jgi:hypothetical protein
MKSYKLVLSLLIFQVIASSSPAQYKDVLSSGSTFQSFFGRPPADFGWEQGRRISWESDLQYLFNFGFKIGSQWCFSNWENFGLGLKMNWVEVSYGQRIHAYENYSLQKFTLELSVVGVGPIGVFAIGDHSAVDIYYNLRPVIITTSVFEKEYLEDAENETGVGFSNLFGCAFRTHFFSAGIEFVYGKLPDTDQMDQYGYFGGSRVNDTYFRLIIGFAVF